MRNVIGGHPSVNPIKKNALPKGGRQEKQNGDKG